VRDAARDYDRLLVNEESIPAKMAASASAAIASASTAMRSAGETMRTMRSAGETMRSMRSAAESIPESPAPAPVRARAGTSKPIRAMAVSLFAAICLVGIAAAGIVEFQLVRHDLPALAERFATQAARLKALIVADRQEPQVPVESSPAKFSSVPNADASRDSRNETHSRTNHPVRNRRQPGTSSEVNFVPLKSSPPVTLPPAEKTSTSAPEAIEHSAGNGETPTTATALVRAGDSLSKIAKRLYGSFGAEDVSRLTAVNPQIKDANVIYVGQKIRVQQASK